MEGESMNEPSTNTIAAHYGYTSTANATGCWPIDQGTLERLKTLAEVLDPKKKIKVTFDYDPDFPSASLQVWEGLKSPEPGSQQE